MIDLSKRKGTLKLRKSEEILGTPEGNMANPRTKLVEEIKKEIRKNDKKKGKRN